MKPTSFVRWTAALALLLALSVSLSLVGCRTGSDAAARRYEFIVLQLNDVYEIAPLEGGKVGGMARVATIRQRLLKENPNTLTVLAGDFLNPSLIGMLKDERGNAIRGAQMVEVMNAAGVDVVTFGNHEFDLKEAELQQRLNESAFAWTSCNAWHKTPAGRRPFAKIRDGHREEIPDYLERTFYPPGSMKAGVRVGLIGVTIPFNDAGYVEYSDVFESFRRTRDAISNRCDVVIAITHQFVATDRELARRVPGTALILGGHDHDHMIMDVAGTRIAKADANARTVYIHRVSFDRVTRRTTVRSTLQAIDESIPADPAVERVVRKWLDIANTSLTKAGYQPDEILATAHAPLDGREAVIRAQPTNLGRLIAAAMLAAGPPADAALLNSGSVRVDDELRGAIRQYDVLRTLPFGGGIVYAKLQGDVLERALLAGSVTNVGTGGFLQTAGVTKAQGRWLIGGQPLDVNRSYTVVMTDFLSQGREANLGFLKDSVAEKPETLGAGKVRNDLRDVLIAYLRSRRELGK